MERQRWEESEKGRREKIREENSQKQEDPGARKGRKVAKHCVFPRFQQFWQYGDVEKVHIVVAGSTFGRQNVKNIVGSKHF